MTSEPVGVGEHVSVVVTKASSQFAVPDTAYYTVIAIAVIVVALFILLKKGGKTK